MGALLALTSAAVFGAADFLGGVAAKRSPVFHVTATSQVAGALLLAVALFVLPGTPTWADLGWGLASGFAAGGALLLFYGALASGTMSIVSPITASTSALVPFAVGVGLGERPALQAVVGVVCALVAVVLVALEPDGAVPPEARPGDAASPNVGTTHDARLPTTMATAGGHRTRRRAPRTGPLLAAIGAGLGFGLFFVLLAQGAQGAGLWPLLGARIGSLSLYVLMTVPVVSRGRFTLRVPHAALSTSVAAGVLDMTANALYLLAVSRGLLSLIAVLASLYPVSTIVLARVLLGERLARSQWAGIVAAVAAVALIS